MEVMGADNELVKKVLAGKSPRDRAAELVRGTKVKDVAHSKAVGGGWPESDRQFERPHDRTREANRRTCAPDPPDIRTASG